MSRLGLGKVRTEALGPKRLLSPEQRIAIGAYLEGQGDLISRLIMGIIRVTIWYIGVINLLAKSADPPSTSQLLTMASSGCLGAHFTGMSTEKKRPQDVKLSHNP